MLQITVIYSRLHPALNPLMKLLNLSYPYFNLEIFHYFLQLFFTQNSISAHLIYFLLFYQLFHYYPKLKTGLEIQVQFYSFRFLLILGSNFLFLICFLPDYFHYFGLVIRWFMALEFVLVVLSSVLDQLVHLALVGGLLSLSLAFFMEEVLVGVNLLKVVVIQFHYFLEFQLLFFPQLITPKVLFLKYFFHFPWLRWLIFLFYLRFLALKVFQFIKFMIQHFSTFLFVNYYLHFRLVELMFLIY